jgi:hypothetical protein
MPIKSISVLGIGRRRNKKDLTKSRKELRSLP